MNFTTRLFLDLQTHMVSPLNGWVEIPMLALIPRAGEMIDAEDYWFDAMKKQYPDSFEDVIHHFDLKIDRKGPLVVHRVYHIIMDLEHKIVLELAHTQDSYK